MVDVRALIRRRNNLAGNFRAVPGLAFGRGLVPFTGAVEFKDQPDAPRKFAPHYEQFIRPRVVEFETSRVAAVKSSRTRFFFFLPLAVLVVLAAVALANWHPQVGLAVGLVGLFGLWAWVYWPIGSYKSSVKEIIYPEIFKFFGDDYVYFEDGPLSVASLKPSGIIPSYDNSHVEDYVKGSYKDVGLELTEAKLTEERGSGKNRSTVTVFRGIFVLFSANKNFSGQTIVRKDSGRIGNWLRDKFNKLENVALEDPKFEKKFEVYSDDQIEARYLLTPSFMERLLTLSDLFRGSGVQCSFYDNRLLLMIASTHDRFETGSAFVPATFVDEIDTILEEMSLIFQIVDTLKLNERTGL